MQKNNLTNSGAGKKQNWTLDFGAALHGSAKANADMLKCTGRRPALNNLTVQLC